MRSPIPDARLVVVSILLLASFPVQSGPSVADQLQRMAKALRTLAYEGTLVYLRGSRLEALHVVRRFEDGLPVERMRSLSGEPLYVTRGVGHLMCQLDGRSSMAVGRGLGDQLRSLTHIEPSGLVENYFMHPLGETRVADRQATVIGIIPRDHLRYGYRFYLDEASGLPLKTDLMTPDAVPLEQIMFISLNVLGEKVAVGARTEPNTSANARDRALAGLFRPTEETNSTTPRWQHYPLDEDGGWQFVGLPRGFELVMRDAWRDGSGRTLSHALVSDRLAAVSVYIEDGENPGLEGETRIGAVHATGRRIAGYQVTVVGEVPRETVLAVMNAIRYKGSRR